MPPSLARCRVAAALAAVLCAAAPAFGAGSPALNNTWYRYSDAASVVVFVHGILSNSQDAWTAENGAFWPAMLADDPRFGSAGVYLGGYHTSFDSGPYTVPQAADELLVHLRVGDAGHPDPPLSRRRIVFVAHSTGGLVVRYLLEAYRETFQDKAVGLVLLASPSRGSAWSNRLEWLSRYFGNRMAGDLALWNPWILDLDRRFAAVVQDRKIPHLTGIDLFESRFVVGSGMFRNVYVVRPEDAATYFGGAAVVTGTDHFTIAKPESRDAEVYKRVLDFYLERFVPMADALEPRGFRPAFSAAAGVLPWDDVERMFRKERPAAIAAASPADRAAAVDALVEHYVEVRRQAYRAQTVTVDRTASLHVDRPGKTRESRLAAHCPRPRVALPYTARVSGTTGCELLDGAGSEPAVRMTQTGPGTAVCTLTVTCGRTDADIERKVAEERARLRALPGLD